MLLLHMHIKREGFLGIDHHCPEKCVVLCIQDHITPQPQSYVLLFVLKSVRAR